MSIVMKDRTSAGQQLAQLLLKYCKRRGVLVLALPRGGVPVATEIARILHAPLDILVVRKLGAPQHEELAIGAIASGGVRVLNHDVIASLGITDPVIERVAAREQAELERRLRRYRTGRPWPRIADQHVILVDDGIATGATMHAAVAALHEQDVDSITVAVPVAAFESLTHLRREVDEVACLATPAPFMAVGTWYESFPELSDDDVRSLLSARWAEEDAAAGIGIPGQKQHGTPQL